MKSKIVFTALILAIIFFGCSKSDDNNTTTTVNPTYKATLNGQSETPPNSSAATGTANFTLNNSTKVLTGTITYTGLTPTAGHIHKGAVGVAGSVVFPFTLSGNTGSISFTSSTGLDASQVAALDSGLYYVNLHTTAFPGGEIRGQILKQSSTSSGRY